MEETFAWRELVDVELGGRPVAVLGVKDARFPSLETAPAPLEEENKPIGATSMIIPFCESENPISRP